MPAKTINLLPHKDFDQTPLGKFLQWSLTYGRYIIVSTEIIVLLAFIFRFSLDRQITDLNEEIAQKSAIIEANQTFEQQFRNLQLRVNTIGKIITNQDLPLNILKHLENITPSGITFSSYNYAGNKINIQAIAASDQSLAEFLYQLKKSQLLSDINVTNLNKTAAQVNNITFAFEAALKQTAPVVNTDSTK